MLDLSKHSTMYTDMQPTLENWKISGWERHPTTLLPQPRRIDLSASMSPLHLAGKHLVRQNGISRGQTLVE